MDPEPRIFQTRIFRGCLVLGTMLALLQIFFLPEDYNEAIIRLELTGKERFLFPHGPFLPELYSASQKTLGGLSTVIQTFVFSDTHPPLHIISLWGWAKVFGNSLISLRMLSLVAFILGVCFCYSAIRQYSSRLAASSLPFLISIPQIGGELLRCRNYALAFLFVQIAFCAGMKGADGQRRYALMLAYFSGLAFSTHYLSIFVLLPMLAVFLLQRPPIRFLLGSALLGLISASAGIMSFSIQSQSRVHQFAGFPGFEREFLAALLSGGEHFFGKSLFFHHVFAALAFLVLWVFSGIWVKVSSKEKDPRERQLAVLVFASLSSSVLGTLALDFLLDKAILSQGPSRYWSFLGILPLLPVWGLIFRSGFYRQQIVLCGMVLLCFLPLLEARRFFHPSSLSEKQLEVIQKCQDLDLLVIGAGYGRGNPGRWIDLLSERHCHAPLVVLNSENEDEVDELLKPGWSIELLPSAEEPTAEGESRIKRKLEDLRKLSSLNAEK